MGRLMVRAMAILVAATVIAGIPAVGSQAAVTVPISGAGSAAAERQMAWWAQDAAARAGVSIAYDPAGSSAGRARSRRAR